MRAVIGAVASVLVIASLQIATPSASIDPYAHVRPLQPDAETVIADGMARSATFRRLVNQLERSDVIVYVDLRPDMRASIGGSLRFLARSATHRFLRVQLNRADSAMWRTALLGHELQHALEVADDPGVASADGLRALYRRIGVSMGPDTYDSIAAREMGFTVRRELAAGRNLSGWRFARGGSEGQPAAAGESLGEDGIAAPPLEKSETPADRIGLQ
jgi:hypothetical protein